jgi:aspartyl-tRNA(Asn)/glutamyl-tRNA(Gln) amidotransferase subunit A
MTDLTKLTIAEACEGLKNKDYTSTELTEAFLGNIEQANGALNAYVAVTADKARRDGKGF